MNEWKRIEGRTHRAGQAGKVRIEGGFGSLFVLLVGGFVWVVLAAFSCGCAPVELDPTFFVDARFSAEEAAQIEEAAHAWDLATNGAQHLDLVFGATVSPGGKSGRREIVRFTSAEAQALNDWTLHPANVLGNDWNLESGERLALIPDRLGPWSLSLVAMHELGHHFGMAHVHEPDALMSDDPTLAIERYPAEGCVSPSDVVQLASAHACE